LKNGADKITINSAAISNPNLITEVAKRFGSQCMVVAIDTKFVKIRIKFSVTAEKLKPKRIVFLAKK
jgi:cyclase